MYEFDYTVEYVDIDKNNKLSNYGFFKILQEAGCLHADTVGFGLKDTPKNRIAWIVLDWKLKIFSRPQWNSKVHIKTWISNVDMVCYFRDYEILDLTGKVIAKATSRWCLLNIDTHHIIKITPEIKTAFLPIENGNFDDKIQKLIDPKFFELEYPYTILRRDIDTNNHLNNLNYIVLAEQALPEDVYSNYSFSEIEVMYKKQCILGDNVLLCYSQEAPNKHVVSIKSLDKNTLHSIIRFSI
ncbi:MAG: hypothetical protein IKP28_01620 [Clostridia bacterium]|nr:hypothetical protein [Clostridia bacterium]